MNILKGVDMSVDNTILKYISKFSDEMEDDDYADYNNGRTRIFVNLDNLSDDIIDRLQKDNPNADIEMAGKIIE
tara:strand:- start:18 stop:239 length:222 start_codon:yes stop_codon:yes gene_type:complete